MKIAELIKKNPLSSASVAAAFGSVAGGVVVKQFQTAKPKFEEPEANLEEAEKVEISPMPAKQRSQMAVAATVTSLVAANTTQRQILGNLRLGTNTGETLKDLGNRFKQNPANLVSGGAHRFTLQLLTQGMPMYYNRAQQDRPKISESMTALWMTTAGCLFEVSGLKQPIEDKALAMGKEGVNYLKRSPVTATCIIPVLLARNNVYSKAVFGQNEQNSLPTKLGIAAIAATFTTPLDNAVNMLAYEAATAKDGTSVTDIYRNTWKQFIGSQTAHPYEKFVNVAKKAMNGTPLRVAGVVGACYLFSKSTADRVEEGFNDYIGSVTKLWDNFQNNVADKGGIETIGSTRCDAWPTKPKPSVENSVAESLVTSTLENGKSQNSGAKR